MTWETTNCLIQAEMKTDIHLKKKKSNSYKSSSVEHHKLNLLA